MNPLLTTPPDMLIKQLAEELKQLDGMHMPEWAAFVKTSHGNTRVPLQDDWWYIRAAAILRKVALKGPIGTQKLRTEYGMKKNRGMKPERFVRASGKIIRTILQQLEKEGLVTQAEKGVHKGRIITPKGLKLISTAARKVRA